MEARRPAQNPISVLNLILTGCGLIFFSMGSYMAFGSESPLFYPGQYFFIFGIVLSCLGMISIFVKLDF
jgi:hypothetical protein